MFIKPSESKEQAYERKKIFRIVLIREMKLSESNFQAADQIMEEIQDKYEERSPNQTNCHSCLVTINGTQKPIYATEGYIKEEMDIVEKIYPRVQNIQNQYDRQAEITKLLDSQYIF